MYVCMYVNRSDKQREWNLFCLASWMYVVMLIVCCLRKEHFYCDSVFSLREKCKAGNMVSGTVSTYRTYIILNFVSFPTDTKQQHIIRSLYTRSPRSNLLSGIKNSPHTIQYAFPSFCRPSKHEHDHPNASSSLIKLDLF